MSGPLTVESVRRAAIALRARDDDGMAVAILWRDVLRAIAEGHPFPRLTAAAALMALNEGQV